MPVAFSRMRELENQRVRLAFDDGVEMVATLLSATEDMDGSQHLIFDQVEWASDPREFATARDSAVHAEGGSLISLEPAEFRTEAESKELVRRMTLMIGLAGRVFGERAKATAWLCLKDEFFGGRSPMSVMETEAGARSVESMLYRIDEGIYS